MVYGGYNELVYRIYEQTYEYGGVSINGWKGHQNNNSVWDS